MNEKMNKLRERAEDALKKTDREGEQFNVDDLERIFHDLKVYQIELELQNEELRNTQKQLEESRNKYAELYNLAPVGYVTLNANNTILQTNVTFSEMLNMESFQLINKSFADLIEPEDKNLFLSRFHAFFKNPHDKIMDLRLIRNGGGNFYARISGNLRVDSNSVVTGEFAKPKLFLIIIDVTLQKKAERLLIESENNYRTLADSGRALVWASGVDKTMKYFNQVWLKFRGNDLESELDGAWIDAIHPEDVEKRLLLYNLAFAKHDNFSVEYRLKNAAGEYRWLLDDGAPRFDASGNFIGYIGHCLDITDLKNIQISLNDSNKQLACLSAIRLELRKNIPVEEFCTNIIWHLITALPNPVNTRPIIYLDDKFYSVEDSDIEYTKFVHADVVVSNKYRGYIRLNYVDQEAYIATDDRTFLFNVANAIELFLTNKENLESLIEREERFRQTFENSAVGIYIEDQINDDLKFNKAFLDMLGYSAEELKQITLKDITHPEDIEIGLNSYTILLAGEKKCDTYEKRFINKNGEIIWASVSPAIINSSQKAPFFVNHIIDITKLKQIEVELRNNNSRLEMAMYAANMAWWEMNVQTGQVIFDKKKTDMLGYEAKDFTHYQDFVKLLHSDDFDLAMEAMRSHISNKADRYEVEYRILSNKGDYIWFYDLGSIVKWDANGNPLLVAGLVIDITEMKLASEKLQNLYDELKESKAIIEDSLNKKNELLNDLTISESKLKETIITKDRFFSIIAHDLRGPFSGLMGLTELLSHQDYDFTLEEVKQMSQSMKDAVNNLYRLLDNLLQWSCMQRGVIECNPEKINLIDVINSNLEIQKGVAAKKNINFEVKANNFDVFADSAMLNTIFRNLISNAIKFTPEGGNVEIGAKRTFYPDDQINFEFIEIYVKDSGIGINADIIPKLFSIDTKTTSAGTNGETGTGLGLLLCKEFVEKHSGKIWVESELGKGSTFYIALQRFI